MYRAYASDDEAEIKGERKELEELAEHIFAKTWPTYVKGIYRMNEDGQVHLQDNVGHRSPLTNPARVVSLGGGFALMDLLGQMDPPSIRATLNGELLAALLKEAEDWLRTSRSGYGELDIYRRALLLAVNAEASSSVRQFPNESFERRLQEEFERLASSPVKVARGTARTISWPLKTAVHLGPKGVRYVRDRMLGRSRTVEDNPDKKVETGLENVQEAAQKLRQQCISGQLKLRVLANNSDVSELLDLIRMNARELGRSDDKDPQRYFVVDPDDRDYVKIIVPLPPCLEATATQLADKPWKRDHGLAVQIREALRDEVTKLDRQFLVGTPTG